MTLFLIFLCLCAGVLLWMTYFGLQSKKLSRRTKNFICTNKARHKKILLMGDSVMRGVGASHWRHSLSSRIIKHSPGAHVTVYAKDGAKCEEVLQLCRGKQLTDFHQVIIFCGGMDIICFSREKDARKSLEELFRQAKSISSSVIYISPPDVGRAPLFPFPFSYIYTHRSKKFLELSRRCAADHGVAFIDYFSINNKDYAEDKSHPNDQGYENLFSLLRGHVIT